MKVPIAKRFGPSRVHARRTDTGGRGVYEKCIRDTFLAIGRLAQRKVHYSRVKFCKIVWYAIFYVKSKHI